MASTRSRGKSTLSRSSKVANSISTEKPLDWAASLRSGDGGRGKSAARSTGSGKRGRGGSARKRGGGRAGRPVVIDISSSEDGYDDDDCCVLDSDPLLSQTLKNKISLAATPDGDFKDDDIAIISERGQVACRDYPHSRHLCVEYPFNKTTHDTCCSKCYCYVCDVIAPCKNWKGFYGHCHASDKDQKWTNMRRDRLSTEEVK